MTNPWEEKDDNADAMPWEESPDGGAKATVINQWDPSGRQSGSKALLEREIASQTAEMPGLESTLTGGSMPMTPEGAPPEMAGLPTTEQFRKHYNPKPTRADLDEQMQALRGTENVTREDVALSPVNAALRVGQQGAGHIMQGAAFAGSLMPAGIGSPAGPVNLPPEFMEQQRREALKTPSQKMTGLEQEDAFIKGKALVETALETHPNINPDSLGTKIGEAIGGFLPAVFGGPFAPFLFGLQSAGATLEQTYKELLDSGMNPDEAARIARNKAMASGVFQGLLLKYFPHQAKKIGDSLINRLVGDTMRKELVPRATRFGLNRAAQFGEGAAFGATSGVGENIIHGRDIGEGLKDHALGMGFIQGFTKRGATPQEAAYAKKAWKENVGEAIRITEATEKAKQRERIIREDGPVDAEDVQMLADMKQAMADGRLKDPKLVAQMQRLELKLSEDAPLQKQHGEELQSKAKSENLKVNFVKLGKGEIAKPDGKGGIVVDQVELAHALRELPTAKEKSDLIDRVVNEEAVHSVVSDSEAFDFWNLSSKAERSIAEERYYGNNPEARKVDWTSDEKVKDFRTRLGHEMIRHHIQKMEGMTPTEVAYLIGFGRDSKRVLSALESGIFTMRKAGNRLINVEGGRAVDQQKFLNRTKAKLDAARKIVERKSEAAPVEPVKAEEVKVETPKVEEAPKDDGLIEGVSPDNIPFSQNPSSRVPELRDAEQKLRMGIARSVSRATGEQMMQLGKGGFNGHNIELGLFADKQQLQELKEMGKSVEAEYQAALKKISEGNPTQEELVDFTRIAMKPQFFNEAIKMGELMQNNQLEYRGKVDETGRMLFEYVGDGPARNASFTVKDTATPEDIVAKLKAFKETFPPGKKWQSEIAATEEFNQRFQDLRSENRDKEESNPSSANRYGNLDNQDFGPSTRRPGESKKDELRRMAEEIRLRKLEAQGVEIPPEAKQQAKLVASDITALKPVDKSERVGAEESGALPRLKTTAMYDQAAKEVASPRPDFDNFSEWVQNNMGRAEPDQLRDLWEDEVNKLASAPGKRFEELRRSLRLTGKYGNRPIPDANEAVRETADLGTFSLSKPEKVGKEGKVVWSTPDRLAVAAPDSLAKRHAQQKIEADQRYRNKVFGAIRYKLISESLTDRADFNRDKISIDDIDFANEKTDHGPYTEISSHELVNPEKLLEILRDEARGSSVDPKSATRRLMAVVDTSGRVHLIGTYEEGGKQRVVDPAGVANRSKPTRELNKTFLNQYRPFASLLITDPIKGFKQRFDSVSEFMAKIGTDASERSRIGSHDAVPEGPPGSEFFAEGTEGIEGEGGSFRGPHKNLVDAKTSRGAQSVSGKPTPREIQQLTNQIRREVRAAEEPSDIQEALEGLEDLARRKKLTAKDHVALNAYRKLADKIQQDDPDATGGQVMARLVNKLWDVYDMYGSGAQPEYILNSFYGKEPAEPVRKSERNQVDLTKRGDIRNPTDQRLFSGPFQKAEAPTSILGKEQKPPTISTPEVSENYINKRVREFMEKTFPPTGMVEPPESMKLAAEEPGFRRPRRDLEEMTDEQLKIEADKVKAKNAKLPEDMRPRGETPESLEQYRRTSKMAALPYEMATAKKIRERIYRERGELISNADSKRIAKALDSAKEQQKKRTDQSRTRREIEHLNHMERQQAYRDRRIADLVERKAGGTMSYRESMQSIRPASRFPGRRNAEWERLIDSEGKKHDQSMKDFQSAYSMVEKHLDKDKSADMARELHDYLVEYKEMMDRAIASYSKNPELWDKHNRNMGKELQDNLSDVKNMIGKVEKILPSNPDEQSFAASRVPKINDEARKMMTDFIGRLSKKQLSEFLADAREHHRQAWEEETRGLENPDDIESFYKKNPLLEAEIELAQKVWDEKFGADEKSFSASRVPGKVDEIRKLVEDFKDFAAGPVITNPEEVMVDLQSPIPRFADNINTALTRAMGLEKIPLLGRIMGPRARMRDPVDRATIGYAVKRNIGNSQAALIGARMNAIKEELGDPFKQDENGRITNVTADPNQSRFISDLFEDWQHQILVPENMKKLTQVNHVGASHRVFPDKEIEAYKAKNPANIKLTPEQDKFFRAMHDVLRDGYEYLREKKTSLEELKGDAHTQKVLMGLMEGVEVYPFPRIALYKRDVGPMKTELTKRIGGSYNVEREREYKTEQEGQQSVAYEPDMVKRLVAFTQRVYKAVADADLANDPELQGKTAEERQKILGKQYEADLKSGDKSQQDIIDMSYRPRLGVEGEVPNHPAFQDKIYPIEIADKLNRAFGPQKNRLINAFSESSTASKALMLTGDLAQYLQQGAPMAMRRPKAWSKAVAYSLRSLADPNTTGRYLKNKENYEAATEFAQLGGSLGHLQDFMSGAQPGEVAMRIPGMRQIVGRSGRAFGTFFDISKIEMWKALRETTPKKEWGSMVEMIDNIVLSGKMESSGLSHGRSVAERLMFMAPAYYRGALQLVAGMGEKGATGSEARKVLGTYAMGAVAGMTGLYLAAGMSWEEIRKRLTPGADNNKFLSFPVNVGDRTIEMGLGGIVIQLVNLMADLGVASVKEPKQLLPWGDKNPIMKFLLSKLGPIPGFAKEWATGKDSQGRPSSGPIQAATNLMLPIAAQSPLQRLSGISKGNKATLTMDAVKSAAGFVGIKTRVPSKVSDMHKLAEEFLKEKNLKKETGWEMTRNDDPSYSRLRAAAMSGSGSEFRTAYEGLLKTHTKREIYEAMEDWLKRGFTGTVKNEGRFYASLSSEEKKMYREAKREKLEVWKAYNRMRREQ